MLFTAPVSTIASAPYMLLFVSVIIVASFAGVAEGAWCHRAGNATGKPNMHPIDMGAPVFVNSVPNGELYTIGTGTDEEIMLLHLYGNNGYDYGYAAGQLIGKQINETMTTAFAYFVDQIEKEIAGVAKKYHLSPESVEMISKWGLEFFLDWQNDECQRFTDPQVYAEMHGIADGSGVDFLLLRRFHLITEVTHSHCSFYGAWGDATLDGKTLQLRALDWDTGAGLQDHPVVTVYHPLTPSMGVPFTNVGWAGWIGAVTAVSSNRIGVTEIGISNPNYPPYFGDQSYVGVPFVFLFRSVMQFAETYKDVEAMILRANRTRNLMVGFADGGSKTARLTQYSHSIVRFFDDKTLEPLAWWHPRIDNIVYAGMDWNCPYFQHGMFQQLTASYGKLTPQLSIQNVTAVVRTGNLHVAVYDLTANELYVANHAKAGVVTTEANGYQRPFVWLNLTAAYAKKFGDGR